jgi:UDP-2,4-diacetamido-2,4,6-trideoxy-beta-L-altropyranose hydrolase
METGTLLIRADASTSIGTGHIMRSIALAQSWMDRGGRVVFACIELPVTLASYLEREKIEIRRPQSRTIGSVEDAGETMQIAGEFAAAAIVLDGYSFGLEFQNIVARTYPILLLDDYGHSPAYNAAWILNQNISAAPELYRSRPSSCELLLGTEYALLRREFRLSPRTLPEISPAARRILVTLGGSDPQNMTQEVIEALRVLRDDSLEIRIVIGGANPRLAALRESAASIGPSIQIFENVSNMIELMEWADLAVTAGGSTTWELAFCGLPMILLVTAENQRAIAMEMGRRGLAQTLLDTRLTASEIASELQRLIADSTERERLSKAVRTWVDGQGADRVCERIHAKISLPKCQ